MYFFIFILILIVNCHSEPKPIFPKGLSSVETGWEDKRSLSAKECMQCHKDTHREWSEGMHAKAWIDPLFQNAFKLEPRQWCINCHAPLSRQKIEFYTPTYTDKALLNEGINCAACHVREGKVLGSKNFKDEFHEVVKSDYISTSQFCENCHQFNFPRFENEKIHYSKEPMQNTFEEWKHSGSSRECQSCHYDGHRLLGNHDTERLLKDFSEIEYEFSGKGLLFLNFALTSKRAHILPTGDLFHSIQFEVSKDPQFKKIYYRKRWSRYYGLGSLGGNTFWNRSLIRNTGIRPEEENITITIDAPPDDSPLYARIVYYFHDEELGGRNDLPEDKKMTVIRQTVIKRSF